MSPCYYLGKSTERVFIARVIDVDKEYAYFEVQETFIGSVPKHIQIWNARDPIDVDSLTFSKAKTYLIFAEETAEGLATGTCDGTTELRYADPEDMAFLRSLSTMPEGGWIQGRFWYWDSNNSSALGAVSGIPVDATGPSGTFRAVTNQAGNFRISGLLPGRYDLRLPPDIEAAEGWKRPATVEIANHSCADVSLKVNLDKPLGITVSGKLTGGDPDNLDDIPIKLQTANSEPGALDWIEFETKTDDHGNFSFANVAEGKYVLGANIGKAPNNYSPYRATYYPAANARDAATIIDVGKGNRTGLEIHMPNPVMEEDVRVEVYRRASDPQAKVYLEYIDFKDETVTDSDLMPNGARVFSAPTGFAYRAHAVGQDAKGHHICAEPKEFIAEKRSVVRLTLSRRDLDCDLEWYVVADK